VARVPAYRPRIYGFDFGSYQIFYAAVVLERVPLSLMTKTQELLGRNCSGSGLENGD
jgi:hypothetical protein